MNDLFSKNGVSLERLQSLEKVVRAGSITRVAQGDPNVQTLLSRQIAELEKTLGLQLLDRTRKPYPPTDSARRLADACGGFVREVGEIVAAATGTRRPITVGAGEVVIREIMIRWIKRQPKGFSHAWTMRNLMWRKIQEELESELLDVGIADRLEETRNVEVRELFRYGYKLVLPEHEAPDKTGWKRLANVPVVLLEGAGRFRRFLAECERETGVTLRIGAECTTYPQVVDMAEATRSAFFVPDFWWNNHKKDWKSRTHNLPGLEKHQRTLRLGWNRKVAERRPEVAGLVKALSR